MTAAKLVDTSIAVDFLRGRREAIDLLTPLVGDDVAVASELTRFELFAGARPRELDALESFCSALRWLPVTTEVALTAAALARRYRKAFSGIDTADYVIAASTLLEDAELLTTNVRHYPMLAGLAAPY